MFCTHLFNFVNYIFLLLCKFRSGYSVSLCCSMYCLCVMCTVLLPPGVNPTAVNKYIIPYHVMSYHIFNILQVFSTAFSPLDLKMSR